MPKLIVTLSRETELNLRKIVREKYSNMRGALSIIVEDAVKKYLEDKYDVKG